VVNEVKCVGVGRIPLCTVFGEFQRMHHIVKDRAPRNEASNETPHYEKLGNICPGVFLYTVSVHWITMVAPLR
jgi:hypothetical protein